MLYEANAAVQVYRMRAWRFRHLKSRESVFLSGLLTSVLGLFLR
jgi:hypothetical protein